MRFTPASAINDNEDISKSNGLVASRAKRFAGKSPASSLKGTTKTRVQQLATFIQFIADMGGRTLNVNFSDEVQKEVRESGLSPFKRRFDENVRRKLDNTPLISVFCLDIDGEKRLHAHGAVLANDNQMCAVRDAVRNAGGEIVERKRHRTQVQSGPIYYAVGWAGYISRNLKKLQKIPGQHIVYSREIHSAIRENMGLVRCSN